MLTTFWTEHKDWLLQNAPTMVLGTLVLLQWIAIQALAVHYYLFIKAQKKPRPDGIRMDLMERTISMQGEQLEKIFSKLSEFSREVGKASLRAENFSRSASASNSLESSFLSTGEMMMKKKLQEMSSRKTS